MVKKVIFSTSGINCLVIRWYNCSNSPCYREALISIYVGIPLTAPLLHLPFSHERHIMQHKVKLQQCFQWQDYTSRVVLLVVVILRFSGLKFLMLFGQGFFQAFSWWNFRYNPVRWCPLPGIRRLARINKSQLAVTAGRGCGCGAGAVRGCKWESPIMNPLLEAGN